MRRRRAIIGGATSLLASLLAGAASMTDLRSNADPQKTQGVGEGESETLEVLIGFRVVGATLHFRVSTGGCTTAADFQVDVRQPEKGGRDVTIALRRLRVDDCKGFFPDGTEITFAMGALGLTPGGPIVVRNPFGVHGGLPQR